MSQRFSDRPRTISGFDIVLSLSEEAVNAQLKKLYDTPIDVGNPLPPPTEVDRFQPLPATGHLINHRMKVHLLKDKPGPDGKPVPRKDGIDGYIQCPKIRFRPPVDMDVKTDPLRKYRYASIEITFTKDEDNKDSILTYFDANEEGFVPFTLTGKAMSWAVNVVQEDVDTRLQALVKENQAINPAVQKLRNYVDSRVFTVASVYCLFDMQLHKETFTLIDENQKMIDNHPAAVEMSKLMAQFYANMQEVVQKTHARVPDFPFSLGYSISQKLPKLADVSPETAAAMSHNKPYFIPKQFALTLTPGDGLDQRFLTTSGTLNFCMLTHRSDRADERTKIDSGDFNAGIIKQNFFDVTKTLGKTKDTRGNTQGHDAIMGFSNELLYGLFLPDLVHQFCGNPAETYRNVVANGLWRPKRTASIRGSDFADKTSYLANGMEVYKQWCLDPVECVRENPYDEIQFAVGDETVKATISSELPNISSVQDGLDHARALYIDLNIKKTIAYATMSRGINTVGRDRKYTTNWWKSHNRQRGFTFVEDLYNDGWLNARTLELTVHSLVRVKINSGQAGKWDIDVDRSASRNLFNSQEALTWTDLDGNPDGYQSKRFATESEYGNWSYFERHHSYTSFGNSEVDKQFRKAMYGWTTATSEVVRETMKKLANGLGFAVVMPAGDVFTFAGLDVDGEGRLFAQANYSHEGGVEVRKG
ncbi:hypothetical protein QBC44DRAFT_355361 [Cladorrhinum sp. PSN332]|nr:hypothetical protein QBC44DRAFT_355361 [Cladorrhinum sp. PSN332]